MVAAFQSRGFSLQVTKSLSRKVLPLQVYPMPAGEGKARLACVVRRQCGSLKTPPGYCACPRGGGTGGVMSLLHPYRAPTWLRLSLDIHSTRIAVRFRCRSGQKDRSGRLAKGLFRDLPPRNRVPVCRRRGFVRWGGPGLGGSNARNWLRFCGRVAFLDETLLL